MSLEEFIKDDKTNSAVARKLEVIGEAVKNLPLDIRKKYKEVPWGDMAKMRDKMIHFYFGIDYEIVWKVVKKRLPQIKSKMLEILKEI